MNILLIGSPINSSASFEQSSSAFRLRSGWQWWIMIWNFEQVSLTIANCPDWNVTVYSGKREYGWLVMPERFAPNWDRFWTFWFGFRTGVLWSTLISQGAPETVIKDARTIIRKLTGKRADNTVNDTPEQNHVSVSQQSYDRLIDHFEELIVLAQTEPSYDPNEVDLKITALQTFLDSIMASNTQVKNALVPYSSALIARDKELYETEMGMVDIALEAKKYVKSVFGAVSPEYRQISGLQFSRPK